MNYNYLIETFNDPKLDKRRNKHFDRFTEDIGRAIMIRCPDAQLFTEKTVQVTEGYSKKIDLGFTSQQNITHYIEFKSISSSFGNNKNNRIEEMVGQALYLSGKGNFSYIFIFSGDYKDSHYDAIRENLKWLMDDKKLLYNFALISVGPNSILEDAEYNIKSFLDKL